MPASLYEESSLLAAYVEIVHSNKAASHCQKIIEGQHIILYFTMMACQASCLVRNLRKAAPNSSQRPGLMEADSPAISYNREKRWNCIQNLQNIG